MKRQQINKTMSYSDKEREENETGVLIVHGVEVTWDGQGRPC